LAKEDEKTSMNKVFTMFIAIKVHADTAADWRVGIFRLEARERE
jgi:hypothetical protein